MFNPPGVTIAYITGTTMFNPWR